MRKLIATMVVFSILISCSQKEPNQIAQRMHRVENGLIEVKSPADMLRLNTHARQCKDDNRKDGTT